MPHWIQTLLAVAALLVVAPLIGWLGHRHGRSIKGTAGLALIMLGFGQFFDPPARHVIDAVEGEEDGGEAAGEPKIPKAKIPDKSRG